MIIYRFDVEYQSSCNFDRLIIHDGGWTNYPVIARMCGVSYGTSYTTTRRRATLQLITDGSVVKRGFEMDYYFHKKQIGGSLHLFNLFIFQRSMLMFKCYNSLLNQSLIYH